MQPVAPLHRSLLTLIALVVSVTLATDTVVVRDGDTLSGIALEHQVTVAELVAWNSLDNPDLVLGGATLVVSSPDVGSQPPAPASPANYRVAVGDTLSVIAARFGVTMAQLIDINSLGDPDLIYVGDLLSFNAEASARTTVAPIRATDNLYTIRPGDTLLGIALAHGVKAGALASHNSIADPDQIQSGTLLEIPTPVTATTPPPPVDSSPSTIVPSTTTAPPLANTAPASGPVPTVNGMQALSPLFEKWSEVYAVPRELLEALAWKESNWNPGAIGPGGHLGVAQISPDTIAFIESNLLGTTTDPLAPSDGIQLEARYLRYLLDRTSSQRQAIAAWNQGLTGVLRDGISTGAGQFADDVLEIRDARS